MGAGEHVGRLGHEMDAAEDHELGVAGRRGQAGQAERVAAGVGPAHHLVPLVVVAEDHQPGAERLPWPPRSGAPDRRSWLSDIVPR